MVPGHVRVKRHEPVASPDTRQAELFQLEQELMFGKKEEEEEKGDDDDEPRLSTFRPKLNLAMDAFLRDSGHILEEVLGEEGVKGIVEGAANGADPVNGKVQIVR